MSKMSLGAVIGVLVVYSAFMTWLHYREIALIDSMLRCAAKAVVIIA